MAPCDGTLALRLITALRLLHVLPVWTQAMPVCQALYACGALLGVKQTRALTVLQNL
jgi:hypothetical protein